MNPRNLNENYADYYTYEQNADAWWHQLDLDKERQAEELLRADIDRKNLHEQPQPEKQP